MNPKIAPVIEAPIKDYRAPLRFWHWASALLISLQLMTILFQKVIVNSRSAVPEFQQALTKDNVAITTQQGRAFAHIISERIWDWHIYFGWTLVALWVLRLGLQLTGPSELRFSARLMKFCAATAWPRQRTRAKPAKFYLPNPPTRCSTSLSPSW